MSQRSGSIDATGPPHEIPAHENPVPGVVLQSMYRKLGVNRMMTFVPAAGTSIDAVEALARDAENAGAELTPR